MPYIGNSPANVGNYQIVDDISSTFNGVLTSFALTAATQTINPAKSGQLLVSINGVLQEPDDTGTEGFLVSGSNIVFSSAPATGSTFWCVFQGQNVDIGIPSDDTVGLTQLSATGTPNTSTFLRGDNTWVIPTDTDTTTTLSVAANILTYTDEDGLATNIDLSLYLDDTNAAYIASGSLNGSTGVATFTRSDATSFDVNMSAFLDDTTVTVNNTLTSTSTTEALSAAQGKALNTRVLLNDAKVSNVAHPLVETAVPVGALFTDTIYTHPSEHTISEVTGLAGSIGRINSPLLDLPLTNSLSMRSGVGSVTFARTTTATYVDRYGVLQTAPIDEPRFEKEGLLIEGTSTNLLPYSDDFSSWNLANITVASDSTLSPDGVTYADKMTDTSSTAEAYMHQVITVPDDSATYTLSVFVKAFDLSEIVLWTNIYPGGTSTSTVFNFASETATNNGKVQKLDNGWYRLSISVTNNSSGNTSLQFRVQAENWGDSGVDTGSHYVWGAQLEELPFVSSYIPTTSSAVTRGQDVATVSYDNNMMSATQELTVVADMNVPSYNVLNTSPRGWFGIVGETYRYIRTAHNVINGSVAGTGLLASFTISKALNNYCFTSNSTGIISYVDGASVSTGSALTVQRTGATSISLGETGHSSSTKLFGHIKNFKTYDITLTANEIKLLQGA